MTTNEYLEQVLLSQTLAGDSEELKQLRQHRKNVETLINKDFEESSPTIRYGGSMAKGTMIKAAYDLDLPCYFAHDDEGVGETLKEIYGNLKTALGKEYHTEEKTSAIRLQDPGDLSDFHIDVVPGRFVDDNKHDVFLYQASAEKERLKTNLDLHIEHIRDSGVVDAVRLVKFWRERSSLRMKTFVLELLVVALLKHRKNASFEKQLMHVWTEFQDNINDLSVEDPANPTGNDLSGYLDIVRMALASSARATLALVETGNWEAIFGRVEEESKGAHVASLERIAASVSAPRKPWCSGR